MAREHRLDLIQAAHHNLHIPPECLHRAVVCAGVTFIPAACSANVPREDDVVMVIQICTLPCRMPPQRNSFHFVSLSQVKPVSGRDQDQLILLVRDDVVPVKLRIDIFSVFIKQIIPDMRIHGPSHGEFFVLMAVAAGKLSISIGVIVVVMGVGHKDFLIAAHQMLHQSLQVSDAKPCINQQHPLRTVDHIHPQISRAVHGLLKQRPNILPYPIGFYIRVDLRIKFLQCTVFPQDLHIRPADRTFFLPQQPVRLQFRLDITVWYRASTWHKIHSFHDSLSHFHCLAYTWQGQKIPDRQQHHIRFALINQTIPVPQGCHREPCPFSGTDSHR